MDSLRQIKKEAFALDDQTQRDFESWRVERAQRQNVVRKDYGAASELRASQPRSQPTQHVMDEASSAAWNAWIETHLSREREFFHNVVAQALSEERAQIHKTFDQVTRVIGEESGKITGKLHRRINELEARIATLERERDSYSG